MSLNCSQFPTLQFMVNFQRWMHCAGKQRTYTHDWFRSLLTHICSKNNNKLLSLCVIVGFDLIFFFLGDFILSIYFNSKGYNW